MELFHLLPRWIDIEHFPSKRKALLILSKKRPKTLIVFIHGFNGSPLKTWNEFPSLVNTHSAFEVCDMAFYDYDSKGIQAAASGINLAHFITRISSRNERLSIDDIQYGAYSNYKYDKILFVAHSLGAIVTRRAMIYAYEKHLPWVQSASMFFFAPAHKGAIAILPIMQMFFPGPLQIIAGFLRFKIPTINDVDMKLPDCSLLDLFAQTQRLYEEKVSENVFIANAIIWAENEKIVKNEKFFLDPPADLINKKSHTNICNPNKKYILPLELIVNCV